VLANDLDLAAYFEKAANSSRKPKQLANWILNDLQNVLTNVGLTIKQCPLPPAALDELVTLIDEGRISGRQAKEVFAEMFARGMSAIAVVTEKGFTQLSDRGALEKLCDEVLAARPKSVADFRSGTAAALNFLKGQVIKLSTGQANPALVGEILLAKLNSTSAG
jgi:aspartyl-tRNA(Asn)/glutamyl-tRNA(Gln) amidotransferase subunit B